MQIWVVLILAALLCAGVSVFVLRAYRRAAGAEARPLPALILCGVAAVAALGVYLLIGRPDMADQPYAARMEALRNRDPASFTVDEALAVLAQAARNHPGDPQPHIFIGDILLDAGRPQDAGRAYDAALRRDSRAPAALLGMGRSLVQIEEGRVSPDALRMFQAAAEAVPTDPTPWVYLAMAAMQQNAGADAARAWGEARARMAPDDPRIAMAERMSRGEAMQAPTQAPLGSP
jgi:cytochrome c-type biogenesis protein CcmH